MAIVSDDYRKEQEELLADPIIHAMAKGLAGVEMDQMAHPGGTPLHEFMGAANREYRERGGTGGFSIGGVAHALITLVENERGA